MNIQIDEETTVRGLIVTHPQTRKVLESFGIDTCCGGGSALADAAAKAGVALADVVAAIEQAAATPPSREQANERVWNAAILAELVEHIESTHHAFMKDVLPRLDELFANVLSAHGAAHGDMLSPLQRTFASLRAEIEMHLAKEEQVLFPYIRQMEAAVTQTGTVPPMHCGTVSNPIRQMESEHEDAGAALARMHALTSDYALPADACPTFAALFDTLQKLEADLHEHIHLENNILFPRAQAMEQDGK